MCVEPEKLAAICFLGNTVAEIENELDCLSLEQLKRILVIFDCGIEGITEKILRTKGLKCSTKPNSTTKLKSTSTSKPATFF